MPKLPPDRPRRVVRSSPLSSGPITRVLSRPLSGVTNGLVLGETQWVSIMELIYELLSDLIQPETWVERVLVFAATVLIWKLLSGSGRRDSPGARPQRPEERRTLSPSHQTHAGYGREERAPAAEEDSTGWGDEMFDKIVVPFLLMALAIFIVVVVAGCL